MAAILEPNVIKLVNTERVCGEFNVVGCCIHHRGVEQPAGEVSREGADELLQGVVGGGLELYAAHKIPEYWIVNLVDQQLEASTESQGQEYLTHHTHGLTKSFALARFPDLKRPWLPEGFLDQQRPAGTRQAGPNPRQSASSHGDRRPATNRTGSGQSPGSACTLVRPARSRSSIASSSVSTLPPPRTVRSSASASASGSVSAA